MNRITIKEVQVLENKFGWLPVLHILQYSKLVDSEWKPARVSKWDLSWLQVQRQCSRRQLARLAWPGGISALPLLGRSLGCPAELNQLSTPPALALALHSGPPGAGENLKKIGGFFVFSGKVPGKLFTPREVHADWWPSNETHSHPPDLQKERVLFGYCTELWAIRRLQNAYDSLLRATLPGLFEKKKFSGASEGAWLLRHRLGHLRRGWQSNRTRGSLICISESGPSMRCTFARKSRENISL